MLFTNKLKQKAPMKYHSQFSYQNVPFQTSVHSQFSAKENSAQIATSRGTLEHSQRVGV